MDQPPEWPPEHVLEPAKKNHGLLLATGQLGWEATPKVAGRLWRRLRAGMASCDLDVVNQHGCMALCRFMYTEHGFAVPTMHDGGSHVHYRDVATERWDRLAKRHTSRPGGRQAGAISGWPSTVKMTEQTAVWCELVRAVPLVDEWLSGQGARHIPPLLWVCSMTRLFAKLRLPHMCGPKRQVGPN